MKKICIPLIVVCFLLAGCSSKTPRQYFEQASLNCNLLYGFAGYELKRDLSMPQEKLVDEKTMKMAPVTRTETVKEKLVRVEENYEKVKALGSSDDSKEMINASLALYEFVLPVYKKEYVELAALYDGNAEAGKIEAATKNITDKYAAKFEELYNNVVKSGTSYAEKHGIEVRTVNPSPR
jgi:uncharacterized protein YcfL